MSYFADTILPCLNQSDKLVPGCVCQRCKRYLNERYPQAMMVLAMEDGVRQMRAIEMRNTVRRSLPY